jgi:hypothetical protein
VEHLLVHQGYVALDRSSWTTISHDLSLVGRVVVTLVFLTTASFRTIRVCSPRSEELRGEQS